MIWRYQWCKRNSCVLNQWRIHIDSRWFYACGLYWTLFIENIMCCCSVCCCCPWASEHRAIWWVKWLYTRQLLDELWTIEELNGTVYLCSSIDGLMRYIVWRSSMHYIAWRLSMRYIVWRSSRTLRLCSSTQMYAVLCLLCDWNTVQNWVELFLTYVCSRHGWSFIGLFSFPMSEANSRKRFRNLIYRRKYT